ncbi:MAG TPA: DNA gyrase inhibitor YacG [Magnetospirillum sp.]|jgi:endogenous inhibitor of DNA gyrase (YacG/DUF329 family)|nr:DNA gyrase inhibitor YacG [Magnetospirillum sp.]
MTKPAAANSNKPCPICGKPPVEKFKPFCSARCADVDLHRWLGGVYRVESDERPDDGQGGGQD